MGTPLTPLQIGSSYSGLLKTTDNLVFSGTLRTITDGMGNDSALQVSTAGVASTGALAVAGGATIGTTLSVGSTAAFGTSATVTGVLTTNGGLVSSATSTPVNSPGVGIPGTVGPTGTIAWDGNYIYVCVSQDGAGGAWKRAALSTY
jgi:hypothetical protein